MSFALRRQGTLVQIRRLNEILEVDLSKNEVRPALYRPHLSWIPSPPPSLLTPPPLSPPPPHAQDFLRVTSDSSFSIGSPSVETLIFGILGVLPLPYGCALVVVVEADPVARIMGHPVSMVTATRILALEGHAASDAVLRTFYDAMSVNNVMRDTFFAATYDLTTSVQQQDERVSSPRETMRDALTRETIELRTNYQDAASHPSYYQTNSAVDNATERFTWNAHLLRPLLRAGVARFGLAVIQGLVGDASTSMTAGPKRSDVHVVLVARRENKRAGTRHWRRGVDRQGHVANFVESEMITSLPNLGLTQSFVQIRGSIPLFWAESPNLKYKPKRTFGPEEASTKACHVHLKSLVQQYSSVVSVNLAGLHPTKAEGKLSEAYRRATLPLTQSTSGSSGFALVPFDFHKECGAKNYHKLEKLMVRLRPHFERMGAYLRSDVSQKAHKGGKDCVTTQAGVVRTNCIDCLDRTNVVQTMLGITMLENLLRNCQLLREGVPGLGPAKPATLAEVFPEFLSLLKSLWADHGDAISMGYAGTGALKSGFTRTGKRSLAGFADDGYKSVMRYYLNTYTHGIMQDQIDLVMGMYRADTTKQRPPQLGKPSLTPWVACLALVSLGVGMVRMAADLVSTVTNVVQHPDPWRATMLTLDQVKGLDLDWRRSLPLVVGTTTLMMLTKMGKKFANRPQLCPTLVEPWKHVA